MFLFLSAGKSRFTKPLFSLNKTERQSVLNDSFDYISDKDCLGKVVCVLDDIFTTGTTLSEIAKVLKHKGAKSVIALTLSYSDI